MTERRAASSYIGEVVWGLTDHLRLEVKNQEYLTRANEHLADGGRIIGIHNHPATIDPLFLLRIIDRFLPDNQGIGYPASSKFFDGRIIDLGIIRYLQDQGKLAIWRVLQPDDEEGLRRLEADNKKHGTKDSPESINVSTLKRAVTFLRRQPGAVLLICPQGTRNPVMLEPSKSIINVLAFEEKRKQNNTLVLPFSISGTEKILRKKQIVLNPFAKATIEVCPLLDYQEIMARSELLNIPPAFAMMMDIAVLQPPKYWGVYGPIINKMMQEVGVNEPFTALHLRLGK